MSRSQPLSPQEAIQLLERIADNFGGHEGIERALITLRPLAVVSAVPQEQHDCEAWAMEGLGCAHCNPAARDVKAVREIAQRILDLNEVDDDCRYCGARDDQPHANDCLVLLARNFVEVVPQEPKDDTDQGAALLPADHRQAVPQEPQTDRIAQAVIELEQAIATIRQGLGPSWPPNFFDGQTVHEIGSSVNRALKILKGTP